MKTLYIIASPRWDNSKSAMLWDFAVDKIWWDREVLNLSESFVPFLTSEVIAYNYWYKTYEDLTQEWKKIADVQSKYIDMLLSADNLVIASPMWNLSMPAILKAWFDLVIKVWATFKMTQAWYEWLVDNIKKAVVVWARWWKFIWTPFESYDILNPQISGLLWFIWIINHKKFWLEWVNMNPEDQLSVDMETLKSQISEYIVE